MTEGAIIRCRERRTGHLSREVVQSGVPAGRHVRPSGTPDQLAAIIKNRLKRIQYRPAPIDGFFAQAGLSLEPQTP